VSESTTPAWRRWLQPVFGVAILAAVLWFLPWRDELGVTEPGGTRSVDFVGTVEGDWKGESFVFVVDEAERPSPWPEWITSHVSRIELVSDTRGGWTAAGFEPAGAAFEVRPGMPRVFKSVEHTGFAWAMASFFVAMLFAITRWWRLMNVAGCVVAWGSAFRLSYLGLFFNLVMPGLTGGDVVKAVLAVRQHPERRSDALVSVLVDRFLGIFALAFLASVVILLVDTFAELRPVFPPLVLAIVVGAAVYTSRRVRKLLRFDAIVERLPMSRRIKSLDSALVAYRRQPLELLLAFLLSLGNHVFAVVGVMSLGVAFGISTSVVSFSDYLAIVPVANIVSSVPLTPGGWGVGEAAYAYLFGLVGVAASLGVAVSVGFRVCQMVLGLCGGLYLLKPGARSEARIEALDGESSSAT
jgi:hypothetical protein